ncbi:nuclear receptor RXR [Loa loa]|uniref:Nuclear receptor RXR n=1 Tax=Loa loa TaxID=7209 RepID=A0A1S0TGQ3_LOALO|nr:nuclear receptor RXR [Loa loa]EFO13605.1 nuclear receptor RXR [Loa loa]
MDLCPSDWFDSNLVTIPASIDLTQNGTRNKRKRETTNRIGVDDLEQPEEQFNQIDRKRITRSYKCNSLPKVTSEIYVRHGF